MFIDFSISEIKQRIITSLNRFPWVILTINLCAIFTCLLIYDETLYKEFNFIKIILCFFVGIPLSIGFTLLNESSFRLKFKFQLNVLLYLIFSLALVYFILPPYKSAGFDFKYIQILFIAHLFVALAPFLKINEKENTSFWAYNYFLLIRILKANVYALTFWIGLALALLTVNLLFNTELKKAFGYLAVFSLVLFQTWFFVAGIPSRLNTLTQKFKFPKELRIFTQFVLVPITAVYLLILYTYFIKILIQWNIPSGYIGWLVSSVCVLGAFTLLLIHPLRHSLEHKWVNVFWKHYFVLILPLLALLFWALSIRIFTYGLTESRFVLFMCGLTLAGLSIYFIFTKKENIKWIPFSLMAFSLITLVGPLNATNLSVNWQYNRLKNLVEKNNISNLDNLKKISIKDANSISSIIRYIENRNKNKIRTYLEENFGWIISDESKSSKDKILPIKIGLIDELTKISNTDVDTAGSLYNVLSYKSEEPISFATAKTFLPLDINTNSNVKNVLKVNDIEWTIAVIHDKLVFNKDDSETFFEISLDKIFSRSIENQLQEKRADLVDLPKELTTYNFEFDELKGTLVIQNIRIQVYKNKRSINGLNGIILLK